MTDIEKIKRIVTRAKYGTVFFASSFAGFDQGYMSKLLSTFEKEGLLERISKGVYLKVRRTRFGAAFPPVENIVREIAKRDKAKIIPTGETAANMLSLSEQVPVKTCFLTSGTRRQLNIGGKVVLLKNAAPRNFEYKNEMVCTLVHALQSIGRRNVTENIKTKIPGILASVPKDKRFEADLRLSPEWIRKLILSRI